MQIAQTLSTKTQFLRTFFKALPSSPFPQFPHPFQNREQQSSRVCSPIRIIMPPTNTTPILQFFRSLPSDIVIDILSRLPIRTIAICKSVCRSWCDLLRSREFVDFHLSKSVPGLATGAGVFFDGPKGVIIYEFDDEIGLDHHDLHYKPLTKVDPMGFTSSSFIKGSANGLVLLRSEESKKCCFLYVCNPITREYIELPHDRFFVYSSSTIFAHGFGVSRMTGQHKVIKIRGRGAPTLPNDTMSVCLVYTLGTGTWRSVTPVAPFLYDDDRSIGVYLNGNLHWLVQVLDGSHCISCFDLETETFSTFALPTSRLSETYYAGLIVLGDCLSLSDSTSEDDDVVIWLMKEYGDDKSWIKEFVIWRSPDVVYDDLIFGHDCHFVHPIKVFKHGDILMALQNMIMFYYSSKTKTTKRTHVFNLWDRKAMLHTSSFLSLSRFVNERLIRF